MKITMFELLGMIKDGKAPKKIKWRDKIWTYNNRDQDYEINDTDLLGYGFCNHRTLDFLNDEIEILEEEKKIPERVLNAKVFDVPKLNNMELSNIALTNKQDIKLIKDTLNEVLDYLKSKGE